jgi:hypothetical protein
MVGIGDRQNCLKTAQYLKAETCSCSILQINPTRSIILLSIFISLLFTCLRQSCTHYQEKLLYLCDTGICHSVWVASGLMVGVKVPIQSYKYQCRLDTVISPDDGHMVARNM